MKTEIWKDIKDFEAVHKEREERVHTHDDIYKECRKKTYESFIWERRILPSLR